LNGQPNLMEEPLGCKGLNSKTTRATKVHDRDV
jgi:hypothetical protein